MSSLTSLSRVSTRLSTTYITIAKHSKVIKLSLYRLFPIVERNGMASPFLYSNCRLPQVPCYSFVKSSLHEIVDSTDPPNTRPSKRKMKKIALN